MSDGAADPRYQKGIALFNAQDFFEAHEVWEELWHETRGEPRDFVQGLIQVTSAFHHFTNGNMRGAHILIKSGLELLAPYGDAYWGMDLAALRASVEKSFGDIIAAPLDQLAGRGHSGPIKIPFSQDRTFQMRAL
jgi:predicted metal-dependent hydrolase